MTEGICRVNLTTETARSNLERSVKPLLKYVSTSVQCDLVSISNHSGLVGSDVCQLNPARAGTGPRQVAPISHRRQPGWEEAGCIE